MCVDVDVNEIKVPDT